MSRLPDGWRVWGPRLSAVALVCLGALLVSAVPANAARVWTPPTELQTEEGEPLGGGSIAFTTNGELLATWAPSDRLPDGSPRGMQFSARPPGGSFGAAATLDDQQHIANFEADRSGGAYIAWVRDGQQLVVAYRPAGGPVQQPTELGSGNYGLALATNAAGDAVIAYNRYGYTDRGSPVDGRAIFTSFRPRGGTWSTPQQVSSLIPDSVNNDGLDVALLPDGRAVYVWEQVEGGSSVVKSSLRGTSGVVGLPVMISRPGRPSFRPSLGVDAAGRALAAWGEAADRVSSGPIVTSHRPAAGPFGAPRELGGSTSAWLGLRLAVSDSGEAIVAYPHSEPLAGGGSQGGPPQAAIGSTVTGTFATPRPLTDRFAFDIDLAANARGDALVSFREFGQGDVEVVRRSPLSAFGQPQAVRCAPPAARPYAAALAPDGAAVLLTYVDYQPMEISEDREAAAPAPQCHPPPSDTPPLWPATNYWRPLAPAARPPQLRLRLTARVAGSSRLGRDRRVRLAVRCNQPCLLEARGSIRIPGRRRALALGPTRVASPGGSERLRVGLSRRRARALSRASGYRRARGTIRLRALSATGGTQTMVFRGIRP